MELQGELKEVISGLTQAKSDLFEVNYEVVHFIFKK